jgi:hypothetical protein
VRRRGWWVAGTAVLVVLALVAGTLLWLRAREARQREQALGAATAFLAAWSEQRYDDLDGLTAGADAPGDAYRRTDERLQVEAVQAVPGPLSEDGRTVPFDVVLQLAVWGRSPTRRRSTCRVGRALEGRLPSSSLHPSLQTGSGSTAGRGEAVRGSCSTARGRPCAGAAAT